ncbi:hypothetical protein EV127DRAFT_70742 [Xylaria flabelliformis]|nr:hypothetical protein EV127DRAFT_70742 [Xylaria flabelliformis]
MNSSGLRLHLRCLLLILISVFPSHPPPPLCLFALSSFPSSSTLPLAVGPLPALLLIRLIFEAASPFLLFFTPSAVIPGYRAPVQPELERVVAAERGIRIRYIAVGCRLYTGAGPIFLSCPFVLSSRARTIRSRRICWPCRCCISTDQRRTSHLGGLPVV